MEETRQARGLGGLGVSDVAHTRKSKDHAWREEQLCFLRVSVVAPPPLSRTSGFLERVAAR